MAGARPSIALAVVAADGLVLGSQTTLHQKQLIRYYSISTVCNA